jgi:hypothetical protein
LLQHFVDVYENINTSRTFNLISMSQMLNELSQDFCLPLGSKLRLKQISEFRKVFGPAWQVSLYDIDAVGLTNAIQSGAAFRYDSPGPRVIALG